MGGKPLPQVKVRKRVWGMDESPKKSEEEGVGYGWELKKMIWMKQDYHEVNPDGTALVFLFKSINNSHFW